MSLYVMTEKKEADIVDDLQGDKRLLKILDTHMKNFKEGPPMIFDEIVIPPLDQDKVYLTQIKWIGYDLEKAKLTMPLNYIPEKDEHGELIYVTDMELSVPFYAEAKDGPSPVVTINLRSEEELSEKFYPELDRGPFKGLGWSHSAKSDEVEIDRTCLELALKYVGKKYESRVTLRPARRR